MLGHLKKLQRSLGLKLIGNTIGAKQAELNKHKDEYQNLFELVPCIITVQDRNYKLIRYNREFAEKFNPTPGDYCFYAYKGRSEQCEICPVEKTFEDGRPHFSEEMGVNKDGKSTYWIVHTSPIKNDEGEVVAAMEMSIDITSRKFLEEQLNKSEQKYFAIFNNIPNPVFVLDADTLEILDCNESVGAVYGYAADEIVKRSFLDLFMKEEQKHFTSKLKTSAYIKQVKHLHKNGKTLFAAIRVSPSEYPGRKVLLVTTSDITKRLETEQQLIQAGKMATLGEMATGIAHELNQPLSVIKTTSSFCIKKQQKNERIDDEILFKMLNKLDSNVDRATKIINHLREFARKSDDLELEKIQVNEVLKRALEIFSQQLKLKGIEVSWDLEKNLPPIMADPSRLEQVFINLLLNARDAIEDKWGSKEYVQSEKKITLKAGLERERIAVTVTDTGKGIPASLLNKIFEPFFTTKEVGKGTGLGLSISYGIVKDFGGDIRAESIENQGTSFIITFPMQVSR